MQTIRLWVLFSELPDGTESVESLHTTPSSADEQMQRVNDQPGNWYREYHVREVEGNELLDLLTLGIAA